MDPKILYRESGRPDVLNVAVYPFALDDIYMIKARREIEEAVERHNCGQTGNPMISPSISPEVGELVKNLWENLPTVGYIMLTNGMITIFHNGIFDNETNLYPRVEEVFMKWAAPESSLSDEQEAQVNNLLKDLFTEDN